MAEKYIKLENGIPDACTFRNVVKAIDTRQLHRARADNSAENLNVLRHWAYNLLKAQSSLKGSFSDKQFKCLLDEASLDKVIASALCS